MVEVAEVVHEPLLNGRRPKLEPAFQNVRADKGDALVLRHTDSISYAEMAGVSVVPDGTAKGLARRGPPAMLVVLAEARPGGLLPGKTARPDTP